MRPLQQGDVLIKKINNLPSNLKKINRRSVAGKQERYILAEGEVTGHAHAICDEIDLYEDQNGNLYFQSNKKVTVEHEEHGNFDIPPGTFEVGIVKEFDHFAEEIRKVAD